MVTSVTYFTGASFRGFLSRGSSTKFKSLCIGVSGVSGSAKSTHHNIPLFVLLSDPHLAQNLGKVRGEVDDLLGSPRNTAGVRVYPVGSGLFRTHGCH